MADYERVIEIDDQNNHAIYNKGICLQRLYNYKEVNTYMITVLYKENIFKFIGH